MGHVWEIEVRLMGSGRWEHIGEVGCALFGQWVVLVPAPCPVLNLAMERELFAKPPQDPCPSLSARLLGTVADFNFLVPAFTLGDL